MLAPCSNATPELRAKTRGKCMARRSGQSPQPVNHRGWWTIRYCIDVPGQEKRMHRRERICPISGPRLLTRPEIERRAKEIIAASGADTVQHFDTCEALSQEWNHEYIDLPVVDPKKHRPTLAPKQVTDVIARSNGRYEALYALLAGTGLRIGEALAIKLDEYSEDHTTISSDCKTIHVRKSIWNGKEQKPKTENAIRSVDVPATLATFLKWFVGDRSAGFLFQTDTGLPLGQSNILRDSLHNFGVEGFHCFRRFRTSQLRKHLVPWDLEKFWIGHANKDITDKYAEQLKEDVEYRRDWVE